MFYLRDLPKHENLRAQAQRYPDINPDALTSLIVLLRVASDTLSHLESLLARDDMSQGRFTVLMVLNRNPDLGLSPADLATKCGVTRATMTGLLDGLEREGFVAREDALTDRRMFVVRLTPPGRAFLDRILPQYYRRIDKLMSPLGEREQRQLVEILSKLGAHVPPTAE